jgi:protein tyrosine phosphatase (PTP) superfamily phosphohydrolase (DUF442 family)
MIEKKKFSMFLGKMILPLLIICATGYCYYIFIANANFKKVIPGKVYRSSQPSDAQLRKFIKEYEIKTVINLRAKKIKDFEKEKITTEQYGAQFIGLNLSGNRIISPSELLELVEVMETSQTPVLIHCKSGVDRGGFASAVAAMVIGHEDFKDAKKQAYVPPGPRKRKDFTKTRGYVYNYAHISDTLKLYEDYCRQNNLGTDGWEQFVQWAKELPQAEELDLDYYKPAYSYFPFLSENKKFMPIGKLIKGAYPQFSVQILIVILITLYLIKHGDNKKRI